MHIYMHKMEHPVMTFPINNVERPNLMHFFSQQQIASNNDSSSRQEGASPNPIIILSCQEVENDTVNNGDEDTDKNQLPTSPTGYPRPTHILDLEKVSQDILNAQSRFR